MRLSLFKESEINLRSVLRILLLFIDMHDHNDQPTCKQDCRASEDNQINGLVRVDEQLQCPRFGVLVVCQDEQLGVRDDGREDLYLVKLVVHRVSHVERLQEVVATAKTHVSVRKKQ